MAGEIKSTLFLGNAYREYCSLSPEDRPNSLRRFVRGWLDAHKPTPEEYADIRPDILPAVRSRNFFESARLRMVIGGNEDTYLQYQTLGDDLGLGLVYDMPDSMKPISNKELELWGVTFYEALEAARENIRQLRPQIIGPKEGEGVYVFTTNDGYDSSRLIILDLIRQFQVKGDYIAMAPGREMLIVAGSEDTPGLGSDGRPGQEGIRAATGGLGRGTSARWGSVGIVDAGSRPSAFRRFSDDSDAVGGPGLFRTEGTLGSAP